MEQITINNTVCFLHQEGIGGPVFLLGSYPFEAQEEEKLFASILKKISGKNFLLVIYMVEDWNRCFSPWPAQAGFGKEGFSGEATATLKWIEQDCIPYIKDHYGPCREFIAAGYSLAGLFALWTLYESNVFSGAICASGSLWYPDWDKYVATHSFRRACDVYLSLGRKEERTRNAVMAKVGDRTREQEQICRKDPKLKRITLEWNDGGHFTDSEGRLAKGMAWML